MKLNNIQGYTDRPGLKIKVEVLDKERGIMLVPVGTTSENNQFYLFG